MPVQHDTYDHWRHLMAYILHISNGVAWIREQDHDIWHKVHTKRQTTCRARITWPNKSDLTIRRLEDPPGEERQCIICQFGLSHLNLVEGEDKPKKPKPPKPPTGGPPGDDYTPNPPAGRLQTPVAAAA